MSIADELNSAHHRRVWFLTECRSWLVVHRNCLRRINDLDPLGQGTQLGVTMQEIDTRPNQSNRGWLVLDVLDHTTDDVIWCVVAAHGVDSYRQHSRQIGLELDGDAARVPTAATANTVWELGGVAAWAGAHARHFNLPGTRSMLTRTRSRLASLGDCHDSHLTQNCSDRKQPDLTPRALVARDL
jgi:hypothetical protein